MNKLRFNYKISEFVKLVIVQVLLCIVTIWIYSPWAIVKILKYKFEHLVDEQGTKVSLNMTGGELFVKFLVVGLLTFVTFGIFGLWIPEIYVKFFADHMTLERNGEIYKFATPEKAKTRLTWKLLGYGILNILTLTFFMPYAILRLVRFLTAEFFVPFAVNESAPKLTLGFQNMDNEGSELFVRDFFITTIVNRLTCYFYVYIAEKRIENQVLDRIVLMYDDAQ